MSRSINTLHPRSLSALICDQVINHGVSLGEAIDHTLAGKEIQPQDRGFIQTLSFGLLRWYWQLDVELKPLLNKPIKSKERLIKYVLLLGLFQLRHLKTPAHAAVSDTVKCCQQLGKPWAKNLVNACLRNYLRGLESQSPKKQFDQHYSHPEWMIDAITKSWPNHAKNIFTSNNKQAPLCLRVNQKKISREHYLALLQQNNIEAKQDPHSEIGIRVTNSLPVHVLPHFNEGWTSVQDTASQIIAQLLPITTGQRVLDACAAPGGKTGLLMENSPSDIEMHAIDIGGSRNKKMLDTFTRLKLDANVIAGDASQPEQWWDQKPYDRILVDAPCSGLGVIRRHPDIKHLRHASDIQELQKTQAAILDACWNLLTENGLLLYTTCSILPEENEQQIEAFIRRTTHVKIEKIQHPTAIPLSLGMQSLPGTSDMDGFYYCLLRKQAQ